MNKEKIEIYNRVLARVLDDFDLSQERLFTCNESESVQARKALVVGLAQKGLADKDIAELTHKLRRCSVCAIRNKYRDESAEWTVRHCLERLKEG